MNTAESVKRIYDVGLKANVTEEEFIAFLFSMGTYEEVKEGFRIVIDRDIDKERKETIVIIKELCAEFGDLDFPDDLHTGDMLDKHLGKYLFHPDFKKRKA